MEKSIPLTNEDLKRYQRQLLYKPFGREAQKRLKAAHVLVAGVGGLGSPVSMYLCVSGIGTLTLVDDDTVTLSNLNRQLLHWESDIGTSKVDSAEKKLTRMNSRVRINAVRARMDADTCESLLSGVNVAVDCLDNMASRYLLNRACVEKGIPLIHGGVYGMMGQLTTLLPPETPCLACIFPPQRGEKKESIPVFGPTAGFIASLQALETIKLLSGVGKLLAGRLLYFNGEVMESVLIDVKPRPACPVCGARGPEKGGKR